jgi:hypothetical protein
MVDPRVFEFGRAKAPDQPQPLPEPTAPRPQRQEVDTSERTRKLSSLKAQRDAEISGLGTEGWLSSFFG